MRQLEQFSLRWTDVDLTRGLITLPDTKAGGVQYVRLTEEASLIFRTLQEKALKAQAIAEAEAIAQDKMGVSTPSAGCSRVRSRPPMSTPAISTGGSICPKSWRSGFKE
ncbi:MAG: hypothetical protein KAX37_09465 [Opitutaceae bacterium]|nr:hypothetical protein [Opitutaceae bacterium]